MNRGAESERLIREEGEVKWCPSEGSKIVEFYKGKNVLVTGATGFLGKLLVEKVLRAFPDVNAVYILVRPKKGEDEYTRIDKLYDDQIFSPLGKMFPKFKSKIFVIKGDIGLPNLGLSAEDREAIIDQVNVIFHIAATVRFDEKLSLATAINVRATRDLLKIAKECKCLQSFLHVSTAYANCVQEEIDEVFYKTPITADELIEMVETVPEKVLIERTPELTGKWPNTYTFTKAIAEDVVKNYSPGLPVCMVRPSIVTATYKEPLRSWIDNLYGATGIVVGGGLGLLRSLHCDKDIAAEFVPGDYVINSMIAASYKTAIDNDRSRVAIYNYVSGVENCLSLESFMEKCWTWGAEVPSVRNIWYYSVTLNKYYAVHLIYSVFLHFLPALMMDLGRILTGQSPIMIKIYKKISKFESAIAHFATNEWKFYNGNTQCLWNCLSEDEQKMFPFSIKEVDWDEYYKTHALGLRIYLVKDDMETLPQARRKYRRLQIAHYTVVVLFYAIVLSILFSVLVKLYLKLI